MERCPECGSPTSGGTICKHCGYNLATARQLAREASRIADEEQRWEPEQHESPPLLDQLGLSGWEVAGLIGLVLLVIKVVTVLAGSSSFCVPGAC